MLLQMAMCRLSFSFSFIFHFHLEAGFKIFSDDSNENDTKTLTWTENILSVFKAKKKNIISFSSFIWVS